MSEAHMRPFTNPDLPSDGGFPLDSDLHRMTDDGGLPAPDPGRLADAEWRDNLGAWDTFADEEMFRASVRAGGRHGDGPTGRR